MVLLAGGLLSYRLPKFARPYRKDVKGVSLQLLAVVDSEDATGSRHGTEEILIDSESDYTIPIDDGPDPEEMACPIRSGSRCLP